LSGSGAFLELADGLDDDDDGESPARVTPNGLHGTER
jgi:hypothetical protein